MRRRPCCCVGSPRSPQKVRGTVVIRFLQVYGEQMYDAGLSCAAAARASPRLPSRAIASSPRPRCSGPLATAPIVSFGAERRPTPRARRRARFLPRKARDRPGDFFSPRAIPTRR
jgi:hypothetical protein